MIDRYSNPTRTNNTPKRFRFSVLEAAAAQGSRGMDIGSKPLESAICMNCKQQNYLVSRPLVDPPHIFFCTNCGKLTPNRAVRRSRGLQAPTIQTAENTGIAQPASASALGKRTPIGLHNTRDTELVDSLRKKGYQILDSSEYNVNE